MDSYSTELQRVEWRKRQARVERMLVRGETNRGRIAARLGMTYAVAAKDVKAIYKKWEDDERERSASNRVEAVRQVQGILVEALAGLDRSRLTAGAVDPDKAGDPTFLRVALEAVREMGRLRGLYRTEGTTKVEQTQINVNLPVVAGVDWNNVPREVVLEARRVWRKAAESAKEPKRVTVDAKSKEVKKRSRKKGAQKRPSRGTREGV